MIRLAAIAAFLLSAAPAQAAPPIFGRWQTDDNSSIIRIEPCGAKLCGRIERVLDPHAPMNDINNPDRALRTKPLVGVLILSGFTGSGASWSDGRAYDPKAGRSYRSSLALLADGKLKVTGCIAFLCRSKIWTRAR